MCQAALGLRDQMFGGSTDRLSFGASRRDPLVLEKLGDHGAAQGIAVPNVSPQMLTRYTMSHDSSDIHSAPGIERLESAGPGLHTYFGSGTPRAGSSPSSG